MKTKGFLVVVSALLLALILVATLAWFIGGRDSGGLSEGPVDVPVAASAFNDSPGSSMEKPQAQSDLPRGGHAQTTRALHGDESLSMTERFSELAQRAVAGDQDALLYAGSFIEMCHLTSLVQEQGFPSGAVTAYRSQLLEAKRKHCQRISRDPNYARIKDFTTSHPDDYLLSDVRPEIRQAFARHGEEAALQTALAAIRARPGRRTVRVVAGEIDALGVSRFYAITKLHAAAGSVGPSQRKVGALGTALMLYACQNGMPCGPRSSITSYLCLSGGMCIPGTGLQDMMQARYLSGQQWKDAMTLLAFLKQLPPY